jgi:cob(I)alamin adenosyltransferase
MSSGLSNRGLIHVYTGNGKGKTTAALGLAVRAIGHGSKVHIVIFMKGPFPYGEREILSNLPNLSFEVFGYDRLTDPNNVKEEEKEQARFALQASRSAIQSNKYDLVILDEINIASAWNLIPVEDVLALIADKPQAVEIVLTGRYADKKLIEAADLVTNMDEVKHPYHQGLKARKGIEF